LEPLPISNDIRKKQLMNQTALSAFIWSVADLLRGDYKQSEYGKVILPFTVLRRLDCVLEATKAAVLAEHEDKIKIGLTPFLLRKTGQSFYNISPLDLAPGYEEADGRSGSHQGKPVRLYPRVFGGG
jgi:type I restriction enzyme M protein